LKITSGKNQIIIAAIGDRKSAIRRFSIGKVTVKNAKKFLKKRSRSYFCHNYKI